MEISTTKATHVHQSLPPGPASRVFGVDLLLKQVQPDMLSFLDSMAAFGDVSYCRLGPLTLYLLNHPDLVHEMLVTQADSFYKWSVQKRVIGQVIGNGTFNTDGDYWKQQRKLVQPAFHMKRVQAYLETIVNETQQLTDTWQSGQEYDLLHEMGKASMSIISKTMFGAAIAGREEAIAHALRVCLATETQQMQALFNLPNWIPTPSHVRFQAAIKMFDDLMYEFINTRRESQADNGDLLSMLLLAADEEHGGTLTDQQVRDEALTLFSAGYETSANGLTWTLPELSKHPEVEAKLVEEVRRVLGDRTPTINDLRAMPYLEMVIKEGLRLHPPAVGIVREPIRDVTIGGYTIPKGSAVFVSQHVLHRDPRYFTQPQAFMPERFAADAPPIERYAYFPFGGGPRICTGQAFAMMEMQIILAMLVQRFQFELTPGQSFKAEVAIVQRPKNGLRATVSARV